MSSAKHLLTESIDEFMNPVNFKEVILNHIKTALPKSTWDSMRARSLLKQHWSVPENHGIEHYETPESLLENAVSDDGLSLDDVLAPFGEKGVEIVGEVNDQPVYFIEQMGIYMWSVSKSHHSMLSLWLSFPAYPPGW